MSHKIKTLLTQLHESQVRDKIVVKEDEEVYSVNLMTSAVALVYEKLRTFIDYNEEHLLRKDAIHRILKRRFIDRSDIRKTSEHIIKELISAGYLPNKQIPESMNLVVAEIITKYHLLFEEIQERKGFLKKALKEYYWLLGIAAAEIEEKLAPSHTERTYVTFLFEECKKRLEVDYPELDEKTEQLYLYVAVKRSLIKSDRGMLNYFLLKLFYPKWKTEYEQLIPFIAENIDEIKQQIEEPIDNKLVNKLMKKVSPYATMVQILKEVIEDEETQQSLFGDPAYVAQRVEDITLRKYKKVKKKLSKSMSRAIVYIFLTKMLLALAIEVPLDNFFYGEIHWFSVFVNISVPVVLMILISLSISMPSKKNTEAMKEGVAGLLSTDPVKVEYVRPDKKRSRFTKFLFNIIYVIAFLIPFYIIVKVLTALNFSVLSMILFLVFLSIVSFFGVRIRHQAKELVVLRKKETLLGEVFDFFTLPIIRFGRWLSLNFSKVNVFAIFMDFVIEAPLKLVLQVLDDWFGFLKEKKDGY